MCEKGDGTLSRPWRQIKARDTRQYCLILSASQAYKRSNRPKAPWDPLRRFVGQGRPERMSPCLILSHRGSPSRRSALCTKLVFTTKAKCSTFGNAGKHGEDSSAVLMEASHQSFPHRRACGHSSNFRILKQYIRERDLIATQNSLCAKSFAAPIARSRVALKVDSDTSPSPL